MFIGELLARPFGTRTVRDEQGWWAESRTALGRWALVETAASEMGPFKGMAMIDLPVGYAKQKLPLLPIGTAAVRMRWR